MKKQIVSAIAAALSFSACERPTVVAARPVTVAAPTVIAARPAVDKPDSGVPLVKVDLPKEAVDALALVHDSPSIDHLARARVLANDADPRGALTEARRALYSSPDDEQTLEVIAKLGRQAGQPLVAAEALSRLAGRRPDDAVPCIRQARALLSGHALPEAIAAGKEAAMRDPGNPEAFQVTGLAQLAQGDLSGAIASFKIVVGLQPDHGYAMNNLGLAYLRANLNAEAVEILEEAAEHLPTVAYVHNNLGVAYERVGRADDAKSAYQQAMDLSPKYVKARLNAARVAKVGVEADDVEAESMSDVPHPLPMTSP